MIINIVIINIVIINATSYQWWSDHKYNWITVVVTDMFIIGQHAHASALFVHACTYTRSSTDRIGAK